MLKTSRGKEFCPLSLLMFLAQCLAHSRYPINIYWLTNFKMAFKAPMKILWCAFPVGRPYGILN